jgi:glycosyltransferase 2 family protein
MNFRSKKNQQYIGIVISVIALIIIFSTVNIKDVFQTIKTFDKKYLLPLFLFFPVTIILRTVRWRFLVNQKNKTNFPTVLYALVFGFFANNVLPAKLGEVLRAEYLKRNTDNNRSFLLGTVLAERILDSILLLMFLIASIFFSKTILSIVSNNIWGILVIVLCLLLIVLFLINKKLQNIFIGIFPMKIKPVINKILINVSDSIRFYRDPILFFKVSLFTLIIWIVPLVYYYFVLEGLGIEIPNYAYLFIVSMAAFGMIIPASPGNVGVFHGVIMASLMIFYPDKEKALVFAIITHAFDFFPSIFFGSLVLIKTNVKLWKVRTSYIEKD